MSEFESINKLLNRGQRVLGEIASEVVILKHKSDKDTLNKVVDALSLLSEVQKSIWEKDPNLSVHYEGDKMQDTKYMKALREFLINSKEHEDNKDIPSAILELQKALEMEPPTISKLTQTQKVTHLLWRFAKMPQKARNFSVWLLKRYVYTPKQ